MLILGVDSSAKTASCGIFKDDKMLVDMTDTEPKTHSEKLLKMIDTALFKAGLDIADIDAFSVCKGPGSFTGLRIGLSTIKGLCHALNKPCFLCSTLSMLYETATKNGELDCLYVPVMDARRNEVYTAVFYNGKKIIEDTAIPVTELIKRIDEYDNNIEVLFVGDGVSPNIEILKEHFKDRLKLALEEENYGSGYGVIKASLKENNKVDYNKILPTYLRPSQAERCKEK